MLPGCSTSLLSGPRQERAKPSVPKRGTERRMGQGGEVWGLLMIPALTGRGRVLTKGNHREEGALRSGIMTGEDCEDLSCGSCAHSWGRVDYPGSFVSLVSCEHWATLAGKYLLQMVKALLYRAGEV